MKNKSRKPSWQYLFFARRIQTGPRHYAAKLVLLHLADTANDSGTSWHGYKSISAFSNGLSTNAIHEALCYLRDNLGILSWTRGSGGFNKKDTNHYALDLEAMKAVVAEQGVFDAETGKMLYPDDSVDSSQATRLALQSVHPRQISVASSERSVASSEAAVGSSERESRFIPDKCNPHGTPKINPPMEPRSAGPVFAQSQVESTRPQVGTQTASGPPIPRTPQGPVSSTPFQFGDPLPGLKWAGYRGAYIDNVTGREVAYDDLQRRIAAAAAMKEAS